MRRAALALAGWAVALGLAAPVSASKVTVGAGSTLDLGTGSLALGCADLDVEGTLFAGTGSGGLSGARDVTIAPSGTLNAGSTTLTLTGNWDNAGTFNAGTSTVRMVDGCALLSGTVVGNTSFANLAINSSSAKLVSFTAGSTQTVTGLLSMVGALGSLLQIRSTVNGSAAIFNMLGTSHVSFIDVQDINAQPGNDIVLGSDSVKGSNTPGFVLATAVPLLGPVALAALALLLLASGQRWIQQSTRAHTTV